MNESDVIHILRDGMTTMLLVAAPPLIVATLVGLTIALFQALTQIQEMTLTFVPKIVAIIVSIMLALPMMYQVLENFMHRITEAIISL